MKSKNSLTCLMFQSLNAKLCNFWIETNFLFEIYFPNASKYAFKLLKLQILIAMYLLLFNRKEVLISNTFRRKDFIPSRKQTHHQSYDIIWHWENSCILIQKWYKSYYFNFLRHFFPVKVHLNSCHNLFRILAYIQDIILRLNFLR